MTEKKSLPLRILKIFSLSIFYIVIAFLLVFSISTISKKNDQQVANFLGYGFLAPFDDGKGNVADSMVGTNKDSFNPNDLIIVKVLSEKDQAKLNLEDLKNNNVVISFYDRVLKRINTHRVVEYGQMTNSSGQLIEYVRTQGDNTNDMDSGYLESGDIIAIYITKVPKVAGAIRFMQSLVGFGVIVVLPMLGLLIYQAIILFINIYKVREEKIKEASIIDEDAMREKIKQELLKELSEKKEEE